MKLSPVMCSHLISISSQFQVSKEILPIPARSTLHNTPSVQTRRLDCERPGDEPSWARVKCKNALCILRLLCGIACRYGEEPGSPLKGKCQCSLEGRVGGQRKVDADCRERLTQVSSHPPDSMHCIRCRNPYLPCDPFLDYSHGSKNILLG